HDARKQVRHTAGGERHHDAHGLIGIGLRGGGSGRGKDDQGDEFSHGTSLSRCASWGKSLIHNATTSRVPAPPRTTEPTGPRNAAVAPARNSPSWLLALMKVAFTALTRPRMSS